ncbi:MAG: hypothetical protein DI536_27855 [Archangium gephyra]|uniref:Uncharacterized protein n=1 Tax=Archangium gephyra TaxID=48 RepID=A0A2W5SWV6_9BACT|nr:MAG: hypothetical protein DI536_27855 [Archangium gephyra]
MARIEGIGVGLRSSYAAELLSTSRTVDWLEVVPENWMFYGGKRRKLLRELRERYAMAPHSVSLDIGGGGPLDARFIDGLNGLVKELDAPFFSDHVCWSAANGRPLHDLLPLPFTSEAVEQVARRSREAMARVGAPLVLENATFYAHMPGGEMNEAAFMRACVEAGDVELLLDLNNVYVNSKNHGFDARAFIDQMPLNKVRYFHLAGHTVEDDVIIDTHIGPIVDDVWSLYRYALKKAGRLVPTLIEWDQEIPPLDEVIDEVDRARAHAKEALT